MNAHPEFELLDEYLLGTLDVSEASRVSDHLRTCATCRVECDAIRPVIDVLPHALPPQSAPEALRDRILAAIDAPAATSEPPATSKPPAESRARLRPLAQFDQRGRAISVASALAAALLLALVANAFLVVRLAQRTLVANATPTGVPAPATNVPSTPPTATTPPIVPSPAARNDAAKDAAIARLTHDLAGTRAQADKLVVALRTGKVYGIDGAVRGEPWHLTVVQPHDGEHALIYSGTPAAPRGHTYRTWVVRGGRTFDAGELPPAMPTTLEMPMALRTGDVVAFSLEPTGSGARPTSPFLMKLKIAQ